MLAYREWYVARANQILQLTERHAIALFALLWTKTVPSNG